MIVVAQRLPEAGLIMITWEPSTSVILTPAKLWDIQSRKHLSTLRSNRPYERLTITGVTGLTEAQKVTLRVLGAVEDEA